MHFLTRLVDVLKDPNICCGDPLYSLDEIKAKALKVINIDNNYCLALDTLEEDVDSFNNIKDITKYKNLNFVFFEKICTNSDGSGVRCSLIFHGNCSKGAKYTVYIPILDTIAVKGLNELKRFLCLK